MYVLYTDDSILAGPTEDELSDCIADMVKAGLILTVEGELADFLGVNITRHDDGGFELTQPHLVDSIIEEVFGPDHELPSPKTVPMASSKLLTKHPDSEVLFKTSIPIVNMLDEMATLSFPVKFNQRDNSIHCKVLKTTVGRFRSQPSLKCNLEQSNQQ
jgi:hypothetical protein